MDDEIKGVSTFVDSNTLKAIVTMGQFRDWFCSDSFQQENHSEFFFYAKIPERHTKHEISYFEVFSKGVYGNFVKIFGAFFNKIGSWTSTI